jgi:TetR/AcrR family transcriptional regulator
VVEQVHDAGARIFAQLWHVGLVRKPPVDGVGRLYDGGPGSDDRFSPSGIIGGNGLPLERVGRPATLDEIRGAIAAYGAAALTAKALGFDGVEIHGAHGYLIDQQSVARMSFLGPRFAWHEEVTSGFFLSSRMSLRSCGLHAAASAKPLIRGSVPHRLSGNLRRRLSANVPCEPPVPSRRLINRHGRGILPLRTANATEPECPVQPFRAEGQAFQGLAMPATSADKLKLFRIRRAPKGGRKPAPGPDIEGKILDAAEFVFGHFGFRGATTALIAKKASIAKPHIYYYFEDKEDLYRAILERAMNMWARDIDNLDTTADIESILTHYIHKKVDFSRDHPDLSRIYANEVISGAQYIGSFVEKVSTPLLLAKVKTVEEWAASGAIRPISAVDLFFCIWAMTQAYADFSSQMTIMKQKRQLERADYDAAKATIVQLVLGGLGLGGDGRSAGSGAPRKTAKPPGKRAPAADA